MISTAYVRVTLASALLAFQLGLMAGLLIGERRCLAFSRSVEERLRSITR